MSGNIYPLGIFAKITAMSLVFFLLTGCGQNSVSGDMSSSSADTPKVDHFIFSSGSMSELEKNREDCQFIYLSTEYYPKWWYTTRNSESNKYSWVKLSEFSDDYKYLSEKGLDYQQLIEDPQETKKCIKFLEGEIERIKSVDPSISGKALGIYEELVENRRRFLALSEKLISFEYTTNNREAFFDLADQKMALTYEKERLFVSIREELDYDELSNGLKVYLERCPDAFSVLDSDFVTDGSILIHNTSSATQKIDFKVFFKSDYGTVIVGEQAIYKEIPAKSKMRVTLSAVGSDEAVQGGAFYPAKSCVISYE